MANIRECKNGRFELNLYDLNREVNATMHAYTNDGNVAIKVSEECGKVIDGFNWKAAAYYNTETEAKEAAEKTVAAAKEIAVAHVTANLEAKIAKFTQALAMAEDEKTIARIKKNLRKAEAKLAEIA